MFDKDIKDSSGILFNKSALSIYHPIIKR